MTYTRVIPRDLFNEAKLLKCMGKLCLMIHDGMAPKELSFEETGESFKVGQLSYDGSLTLIGVPIRINGTDLLFKTAYNSKANYPFYLDYGDNEYLVFDEQGNFTNEFFNIINYITNG